MLLIDSTYINETGGKALLHQILRELKALKQNEVIIILDVRIQLPNSITSFFQCHYCNPNEKDRNKLINTLLKESNIQSLLCFNNVPPSLNKAFNSVKVTIYFHNVLLTENLFPGLNLKNYLKRIYIRYKNKNNFYWVVQSKIVSKKINKAFKIKEDKIQVLPIFQEDYYHKEEKKEYKYCYISNGNKHKNHRVLLKAWEILNNKKINPSLVLTIDKQRFPSLIKRIQKLNKNGVNILNFGIVPREFALDLMDKSETMIFPSKYESFGLPLIESVNRGLYIVAANKDYVKEVINTSCVFSEDNPNELANIIENIEQGRLRLEIPDVLIKNKSIELIRFIIE